MKILFLALAMAVSFNAEASNQTFCEPGKNLLLAASVFTALGTPALIKTWERMSNMPHDPLYSESYCPVDARKWFLLALLPITLGQILGFADFIETYKNGAACPVSIPHYIAADVFTATLTIKLLSFYSILKSVAACRFEEMPWFAYAEGAPLLGMLIGLIGAALD
jgi:hypothetical protein